MAEIFFLLPAGKGCTVYDVVVNPQFMEKMQTSELFKTFFLTVMMEGLEQKYDTELSRGITVFFAYQKFVNFWTPTIFTANTLNFKLSKTQIKRFYSILVL